MIESGTGTPDLDQIVQLAVLAVMTRAAYSLGRVSSPKVETSPPVKSEEQVDLLGEFMRFNPELQRGMLSYAERMRKGYKKS